MALSYAERIAQVSTYIANRDTHGYSQPRRSGDGTTEKSKFSDGSYFAIHGGDYDCSEMARVCANCALTGTYTSPIPDMWTGNEDQRLKAQGFIRLPFSVGAVRRGDILWKVKHTGIALGDGRQADAHGDEWGGINGPRQGDQTGREIEVRALRTNWVYIYRKEGGGGVSYSNSKLINRTILTTNHGGLRKHAIDTITPHYMCWYTDGYVCAESFVPRARQASANYCIGRYGDIVLGVEECNCAWTSGTWSKGPNGNDQRAVTIECANYMETADGHVYGQLPNATWDALVRLCADICKRNGKKRLVYRGKADYSGLASTDMLLTMHKWFQSTDCPGSWFSGQFERLAKEVNAKLAPPSQAPGKAENDYGLRYRVHQQALGWLPAVHDGQIAGVTGHALRMEALKITPPDGVTLNVLAHIQGIGDKTYKGICKGKSSGTGTSKNDPIIGTTGKQKRIEGIKIDVVKNTNANLKGKQLYYRVHIQKQGWSKWVKAGTYAGTRGKQLRIEAIQMVFR